jgi:hypothetical protein
MLRRLSHAHPPLRSVHLLSSGEKLDDSVSHEVNQLGSERHEHLAADLVRA